MVAWSRLKSRSLYEREPVSVWGAVNAALVATWGVIVLAAGIPSDVAGAVTAAIGAWVLVASFIARRRTTPWPVDDDWLPPADEVEG